MTLATHFDPASIDVSAPSPPPPRTELLVWHDETLRYLSLDPCEVYESEAEAIARANELGLRWEEYELVDVYPTAADPRPFAEVWAKVRRDVRAEQLARDVVLPALARCAAALESRRAV